jgi:5,5'-dehydrodivanillate O-demethylase
MRVEDYTDFVHTGPGTLAGGYLRAFWQPVYRAQDLAPGRAVPVRIMSENLTLYRGEDGTAHVVAFRCAHRGTQLSVGWVEGDSIRCRYHGWRYDGSGQCVEQPGEDPAFATRVRIPTYPTQEYLGLVFVYLGEGEAPPMRRFPDMDRPGVFEVDPPEVWPCNFFNRLDNDSAHVPFTHRESGLRMKQPDRLAVRRVTSEETDYGICNGHTPQNAGQSTHFHMPNVNQLCVRLKTPGYEQTGMWEDRLIFHVPVDDRTTISFDTNLVAGLTGEAADAFRATRRSFQEGDTAPPLQAAERILAGGMRVEDMDHELSFYKQFWIEDYVTQVGQGAIADRSNEHLASVDVGVILKRRLWERELKALAEGKPLTQWASRRLRPDVEPALTVR